MKCISNLTLTNLLTQIILPFLIEKKNKYLGLTSS